MRMLPSEPALLIDGHLVIADVHIGFESGFASGGICLGKESSARKSAQRILKMMKESKSDSLVLAVGDIKSGTSKITDYEWRNVPQFFDELKILNNFGSRKRRKESKLHVFEYQVAVRSGQL